MTSLYRRESLGESLALVEEWGRQIPQDAFARRHAGISTALALEEMRHWKTTAQGMHRLMRTGSLGWAIRAPLVHCWRIAGRRLRQPRWQKDGSAL
jgi:hypothetical protein